MSDRRTREVITPGSGTAASRYEFARRVLIVAGVATLVVALAAALVWASDVFFLFFLAVLLAILLRGASDAVARRTGIGAGWALALVVVVVLGVVAGSLAAMGAMVVNQLDQFAATLPKSLDQARGYLHQYGWGRQFLDYAPSAQRLIEGQPGTAATRITSFFSTTFGILGNLLVLTFLTLYLAVSPGTYTSGVVTLVPPRRRDRALEVLNAIGFHLRWWLIGRLVAMIAVGVITGVGLWIVGVPQFLVLAILAALLTAIPFIGPIVAAIPGILLALMQGPTTALWATAVYVLAQAIENYLITPLIQQNTVRLPPVITIAAITIASVLFGVLGLIVATPLAVTIMVAVKMLYVEDVLGDRLDVPGARAAPAA